MKLGILDADRLASEVVERYGRYSDMFIKGLSEVDLQLDFKVYSVIDGEYPDDINACDGYLLTGSQYSAYEDQPWIHRLNRFIGQLVKSDKKLIGICFGHQMIAYSLGGQVEKSPRGWGIGVMESRVNSQMPWMQPAVQTFRLRVSHQDQVSRIPQGAQLIASNDFCPVEAFQKGNILCFQGHPEFSTDYLKHIINKRAPILGKELFDQAIVSLQQDTQSHLILQWLVQFLKQ